MLPVGTSLVALDILLAVALIGLRNERVTVKGLFSSLPHSVMGIRHNFDRLIADGWIELKQVEFDARIKYVQPTRKLKMKAAEIAELAQTRIERHMQKP